MVISLSSLHLRTSSRRVSNFTLKIMGTASAVPVIGRYQSAHVLDVHGRLFLIDCGEGTQHQLLKYRVSMMKIDTIFITHIHGDHVFGLFGLLSTIAMKGRKAPIDIYAPSNFGPILKFFLSYYGEGLTYEIRFTPLNCKKPELLFDTKNLEVFAFPLSHRLDTFGYMFKEKMPMLNIDKASLDKYKFTLSEIGSLKRGEDVLRPAGLDSSADFMNGFVKCSGTDEPLLIRHEDVTYLPYVPRSYAYVSDTAPFPELSEWVKGVDLLYHESTYLSELDDQAKQRYHSTASDAARCAKEAAVGKLILGHYSSRCQKSKLYEDEARAIFAESYAANDGDVFDIPEKKQ